MEMLLRLAIFAVAFLSLHFGFGLVPVLAALIALVLALLGVWLIVLVFDGDGSPW